MKNNEEIIQDKMHEVEENLGQTDFFNQYILDTLDSFAYRYFEGASKAEKLSSNVMRVVAIEKGIKEAIKLKNPDLRAGIAELVKRVSKVDGPTILRELRVTIDNREPHKGGLCHITARISWGHPEHQFTSGSYIEKMSILKFDDELHFRNTLARKLEEVCELF